MAYDGLCRVQHVHNLLGVCFVSHGARGEVEYVIAVSDNG
jgi:hypothetical protein